MKTNRNNKTSCQLVRYTVLTRGGRAKSRMDNVGRGDWSPQPDCYPVELPLPPPTPRGCGQLEEVQPQRTGCHSHTRLLVKCRAVPDPKEGRHIMSELLLREKARCSLMRVIEIRRSLLGAGVCLAQSTL